MTKINPSAGALSIMEMNGGRLQHVQKSADYLRFCDELQARWGGRVFVVEDLEEGNFAICGREGGKEYIIFHTTMLDDRTIDRIYRADQGSDQYEDVIKFLEDGWAAEDKAEDEKLTQIAHEAGERLAWAFRKDGLIDHENIYGPRARNDPRAIRRNR